jgi:hypothetical protein
MRAVAAVDVRFLVRAGAIAASGSGRIYHALPHAVVDSTDRQRRNAMCRNIRKLRRPDGAPTDDELRDAALQFVRKVSGYPRPSQANRQAFDAAVDEVTAATRRMFDHLVVRAAADAAASPAAGPSPR